MPQSLSNVLLHLVFSTKNRTPWLRDAELRKELYKYSATTFRSIECPALIINGTEDHIHALFNLARTVSIADVVQEVKTETSKWIKTKGVFYQDFHWQAGYGVFSVSQSARDRVYKYIENQEEHHRRRSYQDEFRALCFKHGVDLDERYVWD
jgi:putative transposase